MKDATTQEEALLRHRQERIDGLMDYIGRLEKQNEKERQVQEVLLDRIGQLRLELNTLKADYERTAEALLDACDDVAELQGRILELEDEHQDKEDELIEKNAVLQSSNERLASALNKLLNKVEPILDRLETEREDSEGPEADVYKVWVQTDEYNGQWKEVRGR